MAKAMVFLLVVATLAIILYYVFPVLVVLAMLALILYELWKREDEHQ